MPFPRRNSQGYGAQLISETNARGGHQMSLFVSLQGSNGGISSFLRSNKLARSVRELGSRVHPAIAGRRTFITKAAKPCIEGGGILRDVQQLAGHSSLATTQRYIEGSSDAKRRIVELIS